MVESSFWQILHLIAGVSLNYLWLPHLECLTINNKQHKLFFSQKEAGECGGGIFVISQCILSVWWFHMRQCGDINGTQLQLTGRDRKRIGSTWHYRDNLYVVQHYAGWRCYLPTFSPEIIIEDLTYRYYKLLFLHVHNNHCYLPGSYVVLVDLWYISKWYSRWLC